MVYLKQLAKANCQKSAPTGGINMTRITLQVEGMSCSMCEKRVNEAVRRAASVEKVHASHRQGKVEILARNFVDDQTLENAVGACGYHVAGIRRTVKSGFCF